MIYLNRQAWGADRNLPRKGDIVAASRRTSVFIHHTTITSGGSSPNSWPDLDTVRAQMRRLQTIRRQDLGADVPYSYVAFVMRDDTLVIGEGRGPDRSGAHTPGRNESAFGVAFHGNFEDSPPPRNLNARLRDVGVWLAELRNTRFTRLGSERPADREVFAHRDTRATLCPGQHLFDRLNLIRFTDQEDDEMAMDKATWKQVQRALQQLDPPLYGGKRIDGLPGRNTDIAVQAFERRLDMTPRGVVGESADPQAGIWPATRELLFAVAHRNN